MAKFINEVGNKYGRWTEEEEQFILEHWNEMSDREISEKLGRTKDGVTHRRFYTLGLRKKEHTLPRGLASFNKLYKEYQRSAKLKGYSFELTREDVSFLTKMNCHYCGMKPSQERNDVKYSGANGNYIYNGIDRIDSSKGYTMNNVVACCSICNYMKRSMEVSEFMKHIERIYNHRRKS